MRGLVEEHKKTHDKSHDRDFIDKYLTEIENEADPTSYFYKEEGGSQFSNFS